MSVQLLGAAPASPCLLQYLHASDISPVTQCTYYLLGPLLSSPSPSSRDRRHHPSPPKPSTAGSVYASFFFLCTSNCISQGPARLFVLSLVLPDSHPPRRLWSVQHRGRTRRSRSYTPAMLRFASSCENQIAAHVPPPHARAHKRTTQRSRGPPLSRRPPWTIFGSQPTGRTTAPGSATAARATGLSPRDPRTFTCS